MDTKQLQQISDLAYYKRGYELVESQLTEAQTRIEELKALVHKWEDDYSEAAARIEELETDKKYLLGHSGLDHGDDFQKYKRYHVLCLKKKRSEEEVNELKALGRHLGDLTGNITELDRMAEKLQLRIDAAVERMQRVGSTEGDTMEDAWDDAHEILTGKTNKGADDEIHS